MRLTRSTSWANIFFFYLPSSSKTEVFDDVKYFNRLLDRAVFGFLRNNQINIDISVNEIAIGRPSDRSLDTHQTMFLSSLQNSLAVEILAVTGIVDVRADPAYVLAPPEAPLAQAEASHVQTVAAAAPEKNEAAIGSNLADVELHYLIPIPQLNVRRAASSLVLFERRLYEYNVKFAIELLQVVIKKVSLQIHGGRSCLRYQVVLQFYQLPQLGILLESVCQAHISDKILWSLTCVNEMLTVVIVRVRRLRALKNIVKFSFVDYRL